MAIDDEPSDEPEAVPAASFGLQSRDVLPIIVVATGVASALSGQQPTGNFAADAVLSFLFGAFVVWIARFASSQSIVIAAGLALFFTGLQFPAVLMAGVALVSALLITTWREFDHDSWEIGGAVSAAFTSQAVLNLPNIGFSLSASLLAAIAIGPLVLTGFKKLPEQHRRRAKLIGTGIAAYAVVATAMTGFAALSVRDHVETGIEQAEAGVTAVENGDQPGAVVLLDAAEENLERASSRLGGPLTWPARFVPITAQHARALETASDQGAALARTASRVVTRADVEKIRGQNGEIDLDLVSDVNVELTSANLAMQSAQQSLLDVRSPWLLPLLGDRLDSVQVELVSTAEDIDLANHATAVLPRILGANEARRYLVLFVQPAESREFGGFVGAYGILETDNGQFDLTESGSIDTDLGANEATLTDPSSLPEPYVLIGPQVNPQNLTAVGDLTTIAAAAKDLVPQWRGDPDFTIDGVIAIDPYALAGLLVLTGPIELEGREEPIDADNVVDFLLRDQYEEFEILERDIRQDLLKFLAAEAFDRLLNIEVPGPEQLGAVFGPLARADRLSFVTFDDAENAFLDRVFLSADLPRVEPTTDLLAIYAGTGTASKLDSYTYRDIAYVVDIDPATGEFVGNVELTLSNEAPAGASEYVLGRPLEGLDGEIMATGTNLLAVSVYAHEAIVGVQGTSPIEPQEAQPALGATRSWMIAEVPPGGSQTITFATSGTALPERYDLVIPPSQAANPGNFTLRVQPTAGWRVVSDSTAPDGSWEFTVSTDSGSGFALAFASTN